MSPAVWAFVLTLVVSVSAKKNFLIIYLDDTGYGDLTIYNQTCQAPYMCPKSISTNMDRMAREGTLFTNFYSAHCVCSPSRAALMTGRYPIRTGVFPAVYSPASIQGLPTSEITIAELMKRGGWATGMAGKWHLGHVQGYLPVHRGFDVWTGIPWSHDYCPCPCSLTNTQDCTCRDDDPPCGLYRNLEIFQQPAILANITAYYADFAVDYMRNASRAGQSFFFYLAFHHTHHPQFANPRYINSSERAGGRPNAYGDSVMELDAHVGRVLDFLRESGLKDDTYVFLTSDNGPSLIRIQFGGSPGDLRCGKGTTFEGGQRMPAIMWGANVRQGAVVHDTTMNLDIFPTILKLADIPVPTDRVIDGVDFSQLLVSEATGQRDTVFYYGLTAKIHAVRVGNFKAHWFTSNWGSPDALCAVKGESWGAQNPPLLFNLATDPGEQHPISSTSDEYRTQMAVIHAAIAKQNCNSTRDACAGPDTFKTDARAEPWPPHPFHPWTPDYPNPGPPGPPSPPPPPTPPTPPSSNCTFVENQGFIDGNIATLDATTKEQCCAFCHHHERCHAGVLDESLHKCYLKATTTRTVVREEHISCILPKPRPAPPRLAAVPNPDRRYRPSEDYLEDLDDYVLNS